jgi:hypothetical protein
MPWGARTTLKTEIEVAHSRVSGPRLQLKRADGCCLTLDSENEACILNAKGKLVEGLGIITDAHEFLRLALEFSSARALALEPEPERKRDAAPKIYPIRTT